MNKRDLELINDWVNLHITQICRARNRLIDTFVGSSLEEGISNNLLGLKLNCSECAESEFSVIPRRDEALAASLRQIDSIEFPSYGFGAGREFVETSTHLSDNVDDLLYMVEDNMRFRFRLAVESYLNLCWLIVGEKDIKKIEADGFLTKFDEVLSSWLQLRDWLQDLLETKPGAKGGAEMTHSEELREVAIKLREKHSGEKLFRLLLGFAGKALIKLDQRGVERLVERNQRTIRGWRTWKDLKNAKNDPLKLGVFLRDMKLEFEKLTREHNPASSPDHSESEQVVDTVIECPKEDQ